MAGDNSNNIQRLKDAIARSNRIVVLTGAGISVPSGIPDFRSATGLYATPFGSYRPEEMISHEFYVLHRKEFYEFYKQKMLYPDAKPNQAHIFLAKLEHQGKLSAVITQNIDGLHQAAGSKRVYELHGAVHRNYCERCRKFYDLDYIIKSDGVPKCSCGGSIKPDVVLYGEGLDTDILMASINALRQADLFIVIGTSLAVYPAAGLVDYYGGKTKVVINKSSTPYDAYADIVINDDCAKVFKVLDLD
ncbi:MAG: NAD-dependent protein deacylase [Clostridia bacterium]|nr:NAD-dependent protein deacylase [Clostridia bacterium]